jgi:carbon-monoxide dehydrogenase medium subunit
VKPAAFAYHRPDSLEEALRQLAAGGESAKLIAGGQSLGPMLNMRLAAPAALIDLNDLTELAYVRDAGEALEIGALTRHHQLAESALVQQQCPLLAQAAKTIGHYAIRQRGTLGGSLAHADPAAQLPLVAVALGARITVLSSRGRRDITAAEFFLSAMGTALAADELILCVRFPKAQAGEGTAFQLFNRRHGDFAIVAVAASVALQGDRVAQLRLGLSGVAAVPINCDELLRPFTQRVGDAAWALEVVQAVRAAVNPEDDARIPAVYRQELTQTLVQRALLRALERAQG